MKKKITVYMISSVILITSVIVAFMYYKPHRSVRKEEAAFRMSVTELVDAFSNDENQANSLYVGKVLEVEGALKEIIMNDSTLVLLMGDSSQMTGISCYLQKDQKEKYTKLRRGETVRVKGICNGMLMDVVLDKGILLPDAP
ncbi:MAG: hypothetical protein WEB30_05795 [Cyclobacteriaceae bacterium]